MCHDQWCRLSISLYIEIYECAKAWAVYFETGISLTFDHHMIRGWGKTGTGTGTGTGTWKVKPGRGRGKTGQGQGRGPPI